MGFRIACVGIVVADSIASTVDRVPAGSSLVLVDEVSLHPGGSALNTASVLAAWEQEVSLVANVGDDALGDWLAGVATSRGIDAAQLRRDPEHRTSASVVLVDSAAERVFLHDTGANAALRAEHVDWSRLGGDALHVAGALVLPELDGEPMAELLAHARGLGLLTSLDTTFDSTGRWGRVRPSLPHCDLFAPGLDEARAITGCDAPADIAACLVDLGVRRVAVKLGAEGCWVAGEGLSRHVPGFAVHAVDGTGAGDAFAAGFLYATLDGRPLEQAARLANAAGALATTGVGALGGATNLADTFALAGFDQREPA